MPKLMLRSKIFICISSLTILSVIVISLAVYFLFYQALINNETKWTIQTSDKTKQNIEFVLDLINNTGSALGSNKNLIKQLEYSGDNYVNEQNQINTFLENILNIQLYIKGIYIIGQKGDYFTSSAGVRQEDLKGIYGDYLNRYTEQFTGIHTVTYHPMVKTSVISYIRPIFDVSTGKILGHIIIDIDYELLREMMTISSIQYDEKVLVISPSGETIFNYPYNIDLENIIQTHPSLMNEQKAQINAEVFGSKSVIVLNTVNYSEWKIIRVISSKKIYRDINFIERWALIIFVILCLIFIVASFIISSFLTRPIKELNTKFKLIQKGDLSVSTNFKTHDEIGQLGNSFNAMVVKLKTLINSIIEEQNKKSDLQFQVLQAQINPHFLYNTLDSIKWLAVIQNVNNIADMSSALINLLKYNISKESVVVLLSEELESINNYIKIQKYRYGEIFDVIFDISEKTNSCQIIRFILQPIVENSIIHGFENTESKGLIRISSRIVGDDLIIKVIDNGSGMSSENLEELQQAYDYKKKFSGIGIQNVQERIKVYFGDKYGISFESTLGKGTTVTITLPVIKPLSM